MAEEGKVQGGANPETTSQEQQTQDTSNNQAQTQSVDIEKIKSEIKAEIEAEYREKLKNTLGVESLEEFEKKKMEEEGKYKELLEKVKGEAEEYRRRYEDAIKKATITQIAQGLGAIDVELVEALVKDKAEVRDNKVFIDGKPAEVALKDLFSEKPYLVKASENSGSGTSQKQADKFANVKSYEDLLKDGKLLIEFRRERPEEYKRLYEEHFNK